ncbi:MerR family transcriptional regulator [Candidatus Soleaferrea massiliensis]|uniref:MerR family transcriptional regulator n=1 Tax=Candidatus Soleaferrea massiliensis TaxID=1470354 RepID=UPI00058EF8BE|nr:MerR family transcriptional regulator [Candidatus Soleaferrea massiliensis]
MSNNRAIPQGYMTVGEVAKKMGITVRTLQYYDREGLLSPSAESEGGRRLYTDKDMIKLHQILSMKSLGFSLDTIKNRLIPMDSPVDVANALTEQAAAIRAKMDALSESLQAIEALKAEVLQMQTVDFKKYADIIVNLQMKNEFYWLIKHFDDQTLDHMRSRFDQESGNAMIGLFNHLQNEAVKLQREGVPPESEKGQALAKAYWDMIMEFTSGDMSLLPKLMEIGSFAGVDNEWKQKQLLAITYIEPALDVYLSRLGINPFEEGTT